MAQGNDMKFIVTTIILAVIVSALLVGLRQTALKSAYDTGSSFTVNDSAGVVHTVSASPISGDLTALLYSIGAGLVWLVAIVVIVMKLMNKF